MPLSFASTHLVLALQGGCFRSLLDPPPHLRDAARECVNVGTYPVLVGEPQSEDTLLCSPMILYDHPQIAPESPGDFFDATEIDELLALRTMTLTGAEKAQARATDPRAAALLDRVESMDPPAMERLHGAIRDRAATPPESSGPFRPGARVRLRPGSRRADAQDFLWDGFTATVAAVMVDLEGREHVAVTVDDDPGADLHRWYGRYHYYFVDELELLEGRAE
jgi:hypothetical protein